MYACSHAEQKITSCFAFYKANYTHSYMPALIIHDLIKDCYLYASVWLTQLITSTHRKLSYHWAGIFSAFKSFM